MPSKKLRFAIFGNIYQARKSASIQKVLSLLNGYVQAKEILEDIDHYIVEPGLGTKSGATGALLLAQQAFEETKMNA